MSDEQRPDPGIHALPILAMVLGALAAGLGAFYVFIEGDGGVLGIGLMGAGVAVANVVVLIGALSGNRK